MAKKATTRATKKAVGIRGGTSKQHARAGRLGGLAPHVCRGSECTKLRKAAAAKKAASAKSVTKTAAKKRSLYAGAFDTKASSAKKATTSKKAASAKSLTKTVAKKRSLYAGAFDTKAAPKKMGRPAAHANRLTKSAKKQNNRFFRGTLRRCLCSTTSCKACNEHSCNSKNSFAYKGYRC